MMELNSNDQKHKFSHLLPSVSGRADTSGCMCQDFLIFFKKYIFASEAWLLIESEKWNFEEVRKLETLYNTGHKSMG